MCQCATWTNPTLTRGRCVIVCGTEIERKHTICRPCSLGNHSGQPCRRFKQEPLAHLVKTCAECGYEGPLHQVGSDGRPN